MELRRVRDCDLYRGDCFEVLPSLAAASVDLVVVDPPYGITECEWDAVLGLDAMWSAVWRLVKPRAAVVITACQPYTADVVATGRRWFRCEWIWYKNRGSNFGGVRYGPMREHESVLVFARQSPRYYPIKEPRRGRGGDCVGKAQNRRRVHSDAYGMDRATKDPPLTKLRHPSSVRSVAVEVGHHPTQKPTALLEYLIRTYSRPGELVLDFCMGSGSTGVAAVRSSRRFVGVELDPAYFETACARIGHATRPDPKRPPRKPQAAAPAGQIALF